MPSLIAYKSALDKDILFKKDWVAEKNLSKAIFACKELYGIEVCASVNNTPVHPEDWHLFYLVEKDEIRLYPRMGHDALPWVGLVIGAVVAYFNAPAGTAIMSAAVLKGAVIGYALGSMVQSVMFPLTVPKIPGVVDDLSQGPDYSWTGSMMVTQPDGPVGVIYGQYSTSGTLIMQYIARELDADAEKANYLYMLIALGEGEIEGILKEDESGVISSNADYPWIKINGEFLSRYQGVLYDYRLGTQHQTAMPGFHNISTFYSDSQRIMYGTPVTYTTTGTDIDQFEVQLMVPNLYIQDTKGALQENTVQYKLEYKLVGAPSWTDCGTNLHITGESKSAIYYGHRIPYHLYDSGNICADGTATASAFWKMTPVLNAFDAIINSPDGWLTPYAPSVVTPQWIKYDLGAGNEQAATRYTLTNTKYTDATKAYGEARLRDGSTSIYERCKYRPFPRDWSFQGSNDDSYWVTLDTQSDIDEPGCSAEFKKSFTNTTTYRYYRFLITAGNGPSQGVYPAACSIGEIAISTIIDQGSAIASGQYEIRISRITPEFTSFTKGGDLYLVGVTETVFENIAYRNTAVLGLKLESTEQLQGTTPSVRILLRGKKIEVPKLTIAAVEQTYGDCYWDDGAGVYKKISNDATCTDEGTFVTQWSQHPIWCSRDFILNKRYGIGEYIDSDHFDDVTARTEAKYCWELVDDLSGGTDHRFEMDLSISRFTTAQESLRLLSQNFRGWFIPTGKSYKPVIDRSKDPVQLFNSSNMNPKSLKTTWIKQSQTANLIELQYSNPNREYAVETREIPDEDEWTDSKPLRKKTINARGTCRISQLIRDGKYALNCEKECDQIIEYDADRDTIKCEPGDTIRFQNDLFAWGVGGRIVSATSSSITTNIDVTYSASYQVRVRLPSGTLEVKTVTSVTNNNRTLNISGAFSVTPIKDSVFTYGAASIDSKPFKVIAITKSSGQECKLVCLTESSNKYLDTAGVAIPEPTYSSLPNPSGPPLNIVNLSLTEMANQPGFYISFSIPADVNWHHVDFYVSLDYKNWSTLRTNVKGSGDIEVVELKPGLTYYIKAISYNKAGMANMAPITDSVLISWNSFKPPNVNGLRLDGESTLSTTEFTTRDPKFVWKKTSLTSGAGKLPAGEEPLGAGQYYDDANYKYIVEIWVGGIKKRKEILSDNFYTYTYEKNFLDNGTASSSFTIWVWGFNELANLKSVDPSKLRVSNPAPSAVSGLSATPWMRGVRFSWLKNTELDLDYYSYRVKVETDGWSDWEKTTDLYYNSNLTSTNIDDHGEDATIYIEVKAVDTFGNESSTQSSSGSAEGLNVQPTDISDFAITASKIFTKIPILDSDTWTNDTPDGSSVTWNTHSIKYNGASYPITGGNTDKKYIYWINGAATYSSSDTHPKANVPLDNDDFIIATNIDGEASLAWNAIANQVIGSAYIQELAVLNAHIYTLEAGKIQTGAISSNNWAAAAGFRLDLDNEWFKMGGSNVTAAGAAAGIFEGLDGGVYKKYIGGGSDEYFLFNGTNIIISLSSANALTLKSGGGIVVEVGGDINMESTSGNTSDLNFIADSRTYSFKTSYDNDMLSLVSDTDGSGFISIGYDLDASTLLRPYGIEFYAFNHLYLQSHYDSDEIATYSSISTSISQKINLLTRRASLYTGIEVETADPTTSVITLRAAYVLPHTTNWTQLGSMSNYYLNAFTVNIYRDNEYALSCVPDKKNLYIGDGALDELREMQLRAINVEGKWGKTDPKHIPAEIKGPIIDWGEHKNIQTINTEARTAFIISALLVLDERLDAFERDKTKE